MLNVLRVRLRRASLRTLPGGSRHAVAQPFASGAVIDITPVHIEYFLL
jgi:hypothetical protein